MALSKLDSSIEGLHSRAADYNQDLHRLHSETAFAHQEIFARTTDVHRAVGSLQSTTSDIHLNIQDIKSILRPKSSSSSGAVRMIVHELCEFADHYGNSFIH